VDEVNEMRVQIENLKVQIAMNDDKTEKDRMREAKKKDEARVTEGEKIIEDIKARIILLEGAKKSTDKAIEIA